MGVLGLPYVPWDIKLLTLANHFWGGWGNSDTTAPLPPRCICALFSPFGEWEHSCKARKWSRHWELGRAKAKCTAGVCRAGHVGVRWPRVMLSKVQGLTIWYGLGLQQYCHGVVGLPLLLYSSSVRMQKAESHAKEKQQLPFWATERCVDCPAVDKLNF